SGRIQAVADEQPRQIYKIAVFGENAETVKAIAKTYGVDIITAKDFTGVMEALRTEGVAFSNIAFVPANENENLPTTSDIKQVPAGDNIVWAAGKVLQAFALMNEVREDVREEINRSFGSIFPILRKRGLISGDTEQKMYNQVVYKKLVPGVIFDLPKMEATKQKEVLEKVESLKARDFLTSIGV
ncbi:MAG: hypothetical protein PHC33_02215, partial [Candidatus Omnitrophica bacterium]|nr:hypothetical protein [Candidatus Omnitrophota bacterium]